MFLQNYYTLKEAFGSSSVLGYNGSTQIQLIQYNGNVTKENYACGGYDAFYYGAPRGTSSLTTAPPSIEATYITVRNANSSSYSYELTMPYFAIVFGSSDTAVSLTDYTIGELITGIKSLGVVVGGSAKQKVFTYAYQNTNSTDITIKEVCIFGGLGGVSYYNAPADSPTCATYREVFSTPLVVPAGGTFEYVITVEQNGNN